MAADHPVSGLLFYMFCGSFIMRFIASLEVIPCPLCVSIIIILYIVMHIGKMLNTITINQEQVLHVSPYNHNNLQWWSFTGVSCNVVYFHARNTAAARMPQFA